MLEQQRLGIVRWYFTATGYNTGTLLQVDHISSTENKLTIARNQGQPDLSVFITTVSGLTVSDLSTNRLV
jgi:hypothetical protein